MEKISRLYRNYGDTLAFSTFHNAVLGSRIHSNFYDVKLRACLIVYRSGCAMKGLRAPQHKKGQAPEISDCLSFRIA